MSAPMKNGLLSPDVSAMLKDTGDHAHGKHARVAAESSKSRRQVRKMLEKQGIGKEKALKMLAAMGFSEPVKGVRK